MQLFNEVHKDAVAGDAHVSTALGNDTDKDGFDPATGKKPVVISTIKRDLRRHDETTHKVPFAYDGAALSRLRPDQVPRFLGALTNPDRLPIKTVRLDQLVAMQNRVDGAKVRDMASADVVYHDDEADLPVVVHIDGRLYIADGHHRLAADWMRGLEVTRVRYKDLRAMSNAMKRDGFRCPIRVTKVDADKQYIFGWASIVIEGGNPVIDKQGDIIPVEELENAAYDFVLHSRQHGEMHENIGTGSLIESIVFTEEKQRAIGIDLGMVGWWVGFHVADADTWSAHKAGKLPEFSIGGEAIPTEA
jgi:hypothetical protein